MAKAERIEPLAGAPAPRDPSEIESSEITWRNAFIEIIPQRQSRLPGEHPYQGRGIDLNRKTRDAICDLAERGGGVRECAAVACVSPKTLRRWLTVGEDHLEDLIEWEREYIETGSAREITEEERRNFLRADLYRRFEIAMGRSITERRERMLSLAEARNDWRADHEWLKANDPDRWAPRRQVEHRGEVGISVGVAPEVKKVTAARSRLRELDAKIGNPAASDDLIEGTATEIASSDESAGESSEAPF